MVDHISTQAASPTMARASPRRSQCLLRLRTAAMPVPAPPEAPALSVTRQTQLECLVGREFAQAKGVGRHLEECGGGCQADELAVVDIGPGLTCEAADLVDHGCDARLLPIDEVQADLRRRAFSGILEAQAHGLHRQQAS